MLTKLSGPQVFQEVKKETFDNIEQEFGEKELKKFKELFYGSENKMNMLNTFNERYDLGMTFKECIEGLH